MDYVYDEDELYHHGIKGMKWGVRRFQNEDGTLTPAGKKRYSDDADTESNSSLRKTNKVTHRQIIEKKYRDSGMSEADAKAATDRRIKVEKAIAITAGVTVAACAAYYTKNKWVETHCDQILKAGTTFHNLDSAANPRPGEHLYVNYRQNDNNYFRGHFAVNKMRSTGQVFDHTISATEDIKIPSMNTRKSVFKQLYDKDESFREIFNTHSGNTGNLKDSKKVYKDMWRKFGDKDNPEFNVAKRKYFDALRQKGYEAIVDEWDTNPGVFRSDAPLILLNTSSKSLGDMTIKELRGQDIMLAQANSKWYEPVRTLKTSLLLPHTNHFTESNKTLVKEAAKSAKNRKYIDLAISKKAEEIAKINESMTSRQFKTSYDDVARAQAIQRRGRSMADVGKLLSKHENLTVSKAEKIVKTKDSAKSIGALVGYSSLMTLPTAAISKTQQSKYVRDYLNKHPDTKLTYKQINQMSKYNSQVADYIEQHPNTNLSTREIIKMYYGFN